MGHMTFDVDKEMGHMTFDVDKEIVNCWIY